MNEILEFINRRFYSDCNWLNGNCFYFSIILKARFPQGNIFYDVIDGHFLFKCQNSFYDWTGKIEPDGYLVEWDKFDEYDCFQKRVIVRDCIK